MLIGAEPTAEYCPDLELVTMLSASLANVEHAAAALDSVNLKRPNRQE